MRKEEKRGGRKKKQIPQDVKKLFTEKDILGWPKSRWFKHRKMYSSSLVVKEKQILKTLSYF